MTLTNFQKRKKGTRKSWVTYKGKTVKLDFEPRIGKCSKCGILDEHTLLHHTKYNDNDPLDGVIEVCQKCHGFYHRKVFPAKK